MNIQTFEHSSNETEALKRVVCSLPYQQLHVYEDGWVSPCCYSWLPSHVGNVNEKSLLEILRSRIVKDIQASVRDGSYRYCHTKLCPELAEFLSMSNSGNLLRAESADEYLRHSAKKIIVFLDYDRSCNLSCPSCRLEKIVYNRANSPESLIRTHEAVQKSLHELMDSGFELTLGVTGSGDPFGSPLYFDLLQSLKVEDKIRLDLSTNGVLMNLEKFTPAMRKHLNQVNVSVDAVTESTYKIVRRGGLFAVLRKNLEAFDRANESGFFAGKVKWQLNFVVQKDNYREIAEFARWALGFKTLSSVWYNLIADWGHLGSREFSSKAIWRHDHPEHRHFLSILSDPVLSDQRVRLGSLAPFVNRALHSDLTHP